MNRIIPLLIFMLMASIIKAEIGSRYILNGLCYEVLTDSTVAVGKISDKQPPIGVVEIPERVTLKGPTYTVTTIDGWGFFGCDQITQLVMPNTIDSIGPFALCRCEGLTEIDIPSSVKTMSYAVFENCTGFDGYLKLSSNLATIGRFAFSGCSGLTGDLFIPNSVTAMGWSAFMDCSGFSGHLEIPDSLEEIEETAFSGCNFTSLVIGSSVSKIHSWAFKDNPLQSMTIKAETPPVFINADILPAFENVPKNIPVIVPCGTLEAYRNAEGWNEFTNITEDCDGINEIAEAISVFPNPAQSFVHVEGFDVKEIQCYNELGQLVKRVRNSNEISVSDLPEGVYLLRITDVEGENHAKRLAVNR